MSCRDAASLIATLWVNDQIPGASGLYRADGAAFEVETGKASSLGHLRIKGELDLRQVCADPDDVMHISTRTRVDTPWGRFVFGETSFGSEGYFGNIESGGGLLWVVGLRNSNPFEKVYIEFPRLVAVNNLSSRLEVDLSAPEFRAR